MSRISPGRFLFALLVVAVVMVLQAPEAFAIGNDISVGSFTCSGSTSSGNLFASGSSCPTAMTMDNVFSFLVCNFEQLSSNVMGRMYCGMIHDLTPAVMAAVTLATLLYGIMFTFGLIAAKGEDAIKFILKCAFIVAFATNADYLIGIAYRGAIGAISAGASIAIGLMASDGVTSGDGVYSQLDGFLGTLLHYATDYLGGTAPAEMCKNALFAVLGTMFVVFPLLAYMGILLVARIVMTFFRAVFAYIYAIVGITFLLLLAPFFLIFALFNLTTNLFERWLGYLVSFALQVVLLFSFLAFIFSMHLEKQPVVTNLVNIIMYKSERAETTTFRFPLTYCTLCDFKVVNSDTNADMKESDPDYITKGKLVCNSPQVPIRPTFSTAPDSKGQLSALISFAGNGIMALIILALIIEHLLTLIPSLAQRLASSMNAEYATQLGGGIGSPKSTVRMPGESLAEDFSAGFDRGFSRGLGGKGTNNSIDSTLAGLRDGFSGMRTGKSADGRALYGDVNGDPNDPSTIRQQEAGISGSFQKYLTDPTKFGQ